MINLRENIPIWGETDDNTFAQIKTCAKTAEKVALMADNHLGYSFPIGGVAAYKDKISPSGVGYDIGCGNCAIKTDIEYNDIKGSVPKIMDDIWSTISFGVGRRNNNKVDHDVFNSTLWNTRFLAPLRQMARDQLGTVGSGNHFVDIFKDEQNKIWVGCHFGSRGLGHKIATHFLKLGGAVDAINAEPLILEVNSDIGSEYIDAMTLAGLYAYAGREIVCRHVVNLIGAKELEVVHNHHNFAWKEEHFGETYWVVRKGSTPAFPNQKGFVGGSMGDISVIIEGIDSEESKTALYSTVHGAGRVMSRSEAKGKQDRKTGELKREGKISKQMMMAWVNNWGVELRGADVDESPHCYKNLPSVLNHHEETIRVLHTLIPLGVAMAGNETIDPYKD